MQALNRKEVTSKALNFWLQFGILVFSMLFIVYFFVWASVQEDRKYVRMLQEYKQIENNQILLRYKVDSLFWYVGRLAPHRTSDEKFLVANIRDQKQEVRVLATRDSATHFAGYRKITDKLDGQLALRDTIILLEKRNDDLKREFDECFSKNQRLRRTLNQMRQ